jgi:hypothetical protein
MISIREPEPKQDTPRSAQPEGVDEFLSHEPHRRCAEDDHALLVQPDNALIGPKIEQFGEVEILAGGRVAAA